MAPYWSLYLESLGFSALKIGVLASIPLIVRLLVPNFWGHLADKSGQRVLLLRVGAAGSVFAFCTIIFAETFFLIALILALYSFFWNAIMGQVETITLNALKTRYAKYGRVRLWGSLGFVVVVLALGAYFDQLSIGDLPELICLLLIALLVASFSLHVDTDKRQQSSVNYSEFVAALRSREVCVFFIATFLLHASHGAYYVFYSIYLESAAYTRIEIGGFWTVGVLAEIVLFVFMHRLISRFKLLHLFLISLLLTGLRWCGIALFVESTSLLILMQLLHAFSFGVTHAVAIEFCRRRFAQGMLSRGHAFYSSVSFGAGSAFGALLSGVIWDFGSQLTFYLSGFLVFLGLVLVLTFIRSTSTSSCLQ